MPASVIYPSGKLKLLDRTVNWAADTIKASILLNYTYTSGHDFYNDISGYEASGGSYAPATVASNTVTLDAGTDEVVYNAGNAFFTAVTATGITHVALWKSTGTAGTSPLIAVFETTTTSLAAQNYRVTFTTGAIRAV